MRERAPQANGARSEPGPRSAAAWALVDESPRGESLRRLRDVADHGPAAVAQRQVLQGLFGAAMPPHLAQPATLARPSAAVVQREPDVDDTHLDPDRPPPERVPGSANLVFRARYGERGDAVLGARTGYFKPLTDIHTAPSIGTYDAGQAANTLATSRLAEGLGLPVARERSASHQVEGRRWEGTVSAEVAGARPLREDGAARSLDLSRPSTQKSLSDLQLLDAIVGQSDRRGENILIGDDGAATGIDEEATFGFGVDFGRKLKAGRREGVEDPDDDRGRLKYLGLPSQVDRATAERVRALDPEDLPDLLAGLGYRLPDSSVALAAQRLRRVQAHLARLAERRELVEAWGEETYARTVNEPMLRGRFDDLPRSYIARHLAERRAAGHADGGVAPPVTAARPSAPSAISGALGRDIDARGGHAIPPSIHRFWSGKPMSEAAVANLGASAEASKGTRFRHNLWYSASVERMMAEEGLLTPEDPGVRRDQRQGLQGLGYRVRPIESLAAPEPAVLNPVWHAMGWPAEREPRKAGAVTMADLEVMARKAVDAIKAGGPHRYDELKHFSDVARLLYLQAEGGHHFDVDMGLGEMDLDRDYYHNDPAGNVPLLGSLTAETRDPIAAPLGRLKPSPDRDLDPGGEDVRAVAGRAQEMATMLNGMIASRPKTTHLASAIDYLRVDAVAPNTDRIPSGMLANKHLIYGPGAPEPATVGERDAAKAATVPPYLLDLQHLTDDSDNR